MSNSQEIIKMTDIVSSMLQASELDSVMRSAEWKRLLINISDDVNTVAKCANSESEIAFELDRQLVNLSERVLIPAGYDGYYVDRERKITIRRIDGEDVAFQLAKETKGRIDSKYHNVIFEYKKPKSYKSIADVNKARNQAKKYLESLNEEEEGDYFAVITDGLRCQVIEFSAGKFIMSGIADLNSYTLDRIIRAIIKLSVKELSSDNLIKDLVIEQREGCNLISRLTKVLYNALENMNSSTRFAYEMWMDNFGLSHDDASQQQAIEERRRDLAGFINRKEVKADDEYRILFALQTATAIVAMLIAYKVVSVIKNDKLEYSFSNLLELEPRFLRVELLRMSSGSMASKLMIYNLLELSCFSWVFDEEQWSEEIGNVINSVANVLLSYENMPDLTENTDDLFRELYMAIIPTSVRHSLGEYYTSKWLAEHVIREGRNHLPIELMKHARYLDPAAGSGTFPQILIAEKRDLYKDESDEDVLKYILNEVVSIDANILAVILARVNYFISIADLIGKEQKVFIPVYIGDSTVAVKDKLSEDGTCYINRVVIDESRTVDIRIPAGSLSDRERFIENFRQFEDIEENDDRDTILNIAKEICTEEEDINKLTDVWYELKERNMISPAIVNGIMEFFLVCSLGKFQMIVGNPPWVDWKSLPSVHREKIKNACVSRDLFSGDGRTGGINLNVCALLSNIAAENWLGKDGVISLLMPQSILFQQSYEGYRNFKVADGRKLYFQEIVDWEKAGHPFYPVQQLFCTYIISEKEQNYFSGIPSKVVSLKKGNKLENISFFINENSFDKYFDVVEKRLGRTTEARTAFTYADTEKELHDFQVISGETDYIGREGVEYYPQELQLFIVTKTNKHTVELETYKNSRSKYSISIQHPEIEKEYIRPLIKGVNISRFHYEPSEYVVAFPYTKDSPQLPIPKEYLRNLSPRLYEYYKANKSHLKMQNGYSDSITGKKSAEYYALARTGAYSHAEWYVAFRDNTKWVASVVGSVDTNWGGLKKPAFQNHCVTICEKADGTYISEDEAYYICAILNSHIVEDFILSTSDKRTFKIRLPIKIAEYDAANPIHKKLVSISKKAHDNYDDFEKIESFRSQIDELYRESLK